MNKKVKQQLVVSTFFFLCYFIYSIYIVISIRDASVVVHSFRRQMDYARIFKYVDMSMLAVLIR